jgi:predicted CXXCH cytochrome family protein
MQVMNIEKARARTVFRRIGIRLCAVLFLASAGALLLCARTQAQTEIARTVHNLTPTGPGSLRVGGAAGLCVFCHTPHNANPTRALWNRELPGTTYTLYQSSTLEAALNQPNGTSRLCLSCHDGILALGNLRVPPKGSPLTLGPLTGKAALGTDLSDDHPISFVYDSALALRRGQLADPLALPQAIHLDDAKQLQCTTCHNPHEDRHPKFLRMDNRFGALCTTCHRKRNWSDSTHAISGATWNGTGTNPWPAGAFASVAENACLSCHRPHNAGHPQRLLARSEEPATCTVCHNGSVASKKIEAEFLKPFHHPIENSQWTHDPKEEPALMPRHVACADCHNPHAVTSTTAQAPNASGRQRDVRGVTIGGGVIEAVNFEYEVCLKCHGTKEPTTPGRIRVDNTRNIRLKIDPNNPSYHPVAAPGKNTAIVGLAPGHTASSIILCTDCHNNNEWTPAGPSPRGPHGSLFEPILEREFQTGDPASESNSSYALCYKCHNRSTLLGGSGRFPHDKHVVDKNASCAVCHDVHGSRQNIRLINFTLRTKVGNTVVSPNSSGRLEFVPDLARPGRGSCYLRCHGEEHNPHSY